MFSRSMGAGSGIRQDLRRLKRCEHGLRLVDVACPHRSPLELLSPGILLNLHRARAAHSIRVIGRHLYSQSSCSFRGALAVGVSTIRQRCACTTLSIGWRDVHHARPLRAATKRLEYVGGILHAPMRRQHIALDC
jgi:hypothetical protein